MALSKSILEESLKIIFNPETMPKSTVEAVNSWTDAINNYATTVTPPSINSTIARSAFYGIMSGVTADAGNGLVQLVSAFTAYATSLSVGMAPAFTGTPPIAPINITPVVAAGLGGASGDECAALFATIIDQWFRTGIAVNNVSGVIVPWS